VDPVWSRTTVAVGLTGVPMSPSSVCQGARNDGPELAGKKGRLWLLTWSYRGPPSVVGLQASPAGARDAHHDLTEAYRMRLKGESGVVLSSVGRVIVAASTGRGHREKLPHISVKQLWFPKS